MRSSLGSGRCLSNNLATVFEGYFSVDARWMNPIFSKMVVTTSVQCDNGRRV